MRSSYLLHTFPLLLLPLPTLPTQPKNGCRIYRCRIFRLPSLPLPTLPLPSLPQISTDTAGAKDQFICNPKRTPPPCHQYAAGHIHSVLDCTVIRCWAWSASDSSVSWLRLWEMVSRSELLSRSRRSRYVNEVTWHRLGAFHFLDQSFAENKDWNQTFNFGLSWIWV